MKLQWLLFFLIPVLLFAQSPLDFFPHRVGDQWVYQAWLCEFGGICYDPDTVRVEVTRDSLGPDGKLYVFVEVTWNPFRSAEDTLARRLPGVRSFGELSEPTFKIDSTSATVWARTKQFLYFHCCPDPYNLAADSLYEFLRLNAALGDQWQIPEPCLGDLPVCNVDTLRLASDTTTTYFGQVRMTKKYKNTAYASLKLWFAENIGLTFKRIDYHD
ncbi:hypothetical protein D6779_09930, partial [Candidatus Parcubacteria bacterium]